MSDVFVPITNAECVLPSATMGGRKVARRRVTRRRLALRKSPRRGGRLALFRKTRRVSRAGRRML